jgi:DNA-binding response OmpR family regulator
VSFFAATTAPAEVYRDQHLMVDFQAAIIRLDGLELKMPPKEFGLLACLVRHARELVSREALLLEVWKYEPGVRTRTLDVHIRRLRQTLGPYGKLYIETVFGIGCRFQPCPAKKQDETAAAGDPAIHLGSGPWRLNSPLQ